MTVLFFLWGHLNGLLLVFYIIINQSHFFPVPAEIGDMAQQEDGWPLGLQPVNLRVGLVRNRNLSGSVSFSTLLTASPTNTDSSSDLDTESTGSFFHDKSITLGSLIGLSSILDLSRRSTRGRMSETLKDKKNYKSKTWLFSLCSRLNTDAVCMKDTPSLGHFLEAERRAATGYRRNQSPTIPGPDDFSNALPVPDTNSLFIGDQVAPRSSTPLGSEDGGQSNRDLLEHDNGYGVLFPCLCGQLLKWLAWLNYF